MSNAHAFEFTILNQLRARGHSRRYCLLEAHRPKFKFWIDCWVKGIVLSNERAASTGKSCLAPES